ncbi:helix-turn-helix domain-containing protein [Acetobacter senegalensis]|nr:helix-turn-helix domain-containing protein [Acetobacter senegalensis]
MTLSSLAKDLGCSVTTLHGYVSGRRKIPLHFIVKIEGLTGGKVKALDWLDRANTEGIAA